MIYNFEPPKKMKGTPYTPCLNESGFFCDRPPEYCNIHHVFFGPYRQLSEKWGMKVYLEPEYHQQKPLGAHHNKQTNLELKQYAQRKFEEKYSHEFYMDVFDKNYL